MPCHRCVRCWSAGTARATEPDTTSLSCSGCGAAATQASQPLTFSTSSFLKRGRADVRVHMRMHRPLAALPCVPSADRGRTHCPRCAMARACRVRRPAPASPLSSPNRHVLPTVPALRLICDHGPPICLMYAALPAPCRGLPHSEGPHRTWARAAFAASSSSSRGPSSRSPYLNTKALQWVEVYNYYLL